MPVTMEQHDNGRILQYVYTEPWGIGDLEKLRAKEQQIFDGAKCKLGILVDARGIRNAPPGIFKERKHIIMTHPNSGLIAVVGAPVLIEVISGQLFKLAHYNRVRFFNLKQEQQAWDYLRNVEPSANTSDQSIRLG